MYVRHRSRAIDVLAAVVAFTALALGVVASARTSALPG